MCTKLVTLTISFKRTYVHQAYSDFEHHVANVTENAGAQNYVCHIDSVNVYFGPKYTIFIFERRHALFTPSVRRVSVQIVYFERQELHDLTQ